MEILVLKLYRNPTAYLTLSMEFIIIHQSWLIIVNLDFLHQLH